MLRFRKQSNHTTWKWLQKLKKYIYKKSYQPVWLESDVNYFNAIKKKNQSAKTIPCYSEDLNVTPIRSKDFPYIKNSIRYSNLSLDYFFQK